jgi:hypothetical protein
MILVLILFPLLIMGGLAAFLAIGNSKKQVMSRQS